jgi:hypothetical protein
VSEKNCAIVCHIGRRVGEKEFASNGVNTPPNRVFPGVGWGE